jgi:hypothetical protein
MLLLIRKYKLKLLTFNRALNKLRFLYPNSYFGTDLCVDIRDWSGLKIGKDVQIHSFTVLSLMNDKRNPNHVSSSLQIGDNVFIGETNNIRAGGGKFSLAATVL